MLYDWANRPMAETTEKQRSQDLGRRLIQWEPSDRYDTDASRALTPAKLDSLFRDANVGDPRAQARLALEIEEKDHDIAHNLSTRRAAVQGIEVKCVAPMGMEKDAQAVKIAEHATEMLNAMNRTTSRLRQGGEGYDTVGLRGGIDFLMMALLPGYSVMEILWSAGGKAVEALVPVDHAMVTFNQSREPLLVSRNAAMGTKLAPNKFIYHRHQARSGDATRGGLIRPLAWMYLFSGYAIKDVVRFAEKFGMPFISARLDDNAWEQDRNKVAYLIRNFGSDGGAVFSKAVELALVQGATGGGEVYFTMLEYFGAAKTKVILGQTATSGDGSGFNNAGAQSQVRQDILESDCRAVAESLQTYLIQPWVMFNYGDAAVVPDVKFAFESPEDLKAASEILTNLYTAGLEADEEEQSKKFGITLRRAARAPAPGPAALSLADSPTDPKAAKEIERALALRQSREANDKVVAAALAAMQVDPSILGGIAEPIAAAIEETLAGLPDDEPTEEQAAEFFRRLGVLLDAEAEIYEKIDTRKLEAQIANAARAGDLNGRIAALAALRKT